MRTPDEITNTQDIIDSRDIIARIEYLESVMEDAKSDYEDLEPEEREEFPSLEDYIADRYFDEAEELKNLQALAEECDGVPDWIYGATLIRDGYFTEFAQEECEDLGYISKDFPWWIVVDWEKNRREYPARLHQRRL